MPAFLLDLSLSFSITVSLSLFWFPRIPRSRSIFPCFPSVLLVTTLLRLSLNIASTRLILMHGDTGTDAAGKVIKAFGEFVIGGNFVSDSSSF